MYSLILIVSMLLVVLSPVFIDFFLSVQEMRSDRSDMETDKKKDPRYTWASSRLQ